MPTTTSYPGVYIEEIPSGVRSITGVATSVGAFVGYFARGPMNEAVQIFSFADFERQFGGLRADSHASYAIQQFFLNGGSQSWIVRTANTDTSGSGTAAEAAAIVLADSASAGTGLLEASAVSEGAWGNAIHVNVDYATTDPTTSFNLTVSEIAEVGGRQQAVNTEVFRNLVVDASSAQHVADVVNDGSKLIAIAVLGTPASTARPAQNGTTSGALSTVTPGSLAGTVDVSLNGVSEGTFTLSTTPATVAALAAGLQSDIRAMGGNMTRVTVDVVGDASTEQLLSIGAGTGDAMDVLTFTDDSGTLAADLGLDAAGRSNVQDYVLGSATAAGAQALPDGSQQAGADGDLPGAADLTGSESQKTGMYALLDADLFNILCIPDTTALPDTEASAVASAAVSLCGAERAFYLLDVPHSDSTRDEVDEIKQWLADNASLRSKNAALYYPRPEVSDALNDFRLRKIAASGTIAGLYARTDSTRGVWKAPAGTEATLRGVQRLEYSLTDGENGALNPLAINCLRNRPVFGNVAWGARTLDGADTQASEWKYVPVRRTALMIEESLFRGTQWVVFEPNDEPLWAQIRLNVGAYLHGLFRQGAFQGASPKDAYFVKCDSETTTQTDINNGIVNIVVGFAPLKPAEFVIVKLQQMAGQIET